MTSYHITAVFLPTTGDGLLLYNGYSTDRRGDFFALSLRDGFVEYCFDLGTGPAIIRSPPPPPHYQRHHHHHDLLESHNKRVSNSHIKYDAVCDMTSCDAM